MLCCQSDRWMMSDDQADVGIDATCITGRLSTLR